MVDDTSFPAPPRRPRAGTIVLVAMVAFTLGAVAVAAVIWLRPGWIFGTPASTAVQPAQTATSAGTGVVDVPTLAGRETALAAQLAALEARTATLDTETAAAGGQAARAEAVLVLAAVRRAIERGVGLGYLEEQLRRRFGAIAPRDTAIIIQAARDPVTSEDLRESLAAAGPALLTGENDWWAGIGSELRNLVVIHRAGTPSPLPADRLERAQRMVAAGNVEPAIAEVSRLPGQAGAGGWLDAAKRYVLARAALDRLEGLAIVGALSPPPVVPQPTQQPAAEQPADQPTTGDGQA